MDKKQIQPIRLKIYLRDFLQSRKYAAYILEKNLHDEKSESSKLVHEAFNTSLIISYSRPFTANEELSGQRMYLLRQYVNEVLINESEVKLHERVIIERNNVYGHSAAKVHSFKGSAFMMKPNPDVYVPLSKVETEKLKIIIEKWIAHLKNEKAKQKVL